MVDTNQNGIPIDNIMLLSDSRLTPEHRRRLEEEHIEVKDAPIPNNVLISFPAGWTVTQRGAKRAAKGNQVFEF